MIEYLVSENRKFGISFSELRENYYKFIGMSNEEFLRNLPKATHFACIVCWIKEVGPDASIGDAGIVHELVHLMDEGTVTSLKDIRRQFKKILDLGFLNYTL